VARDNRVDGTIVLGADQPESLHSHSVIPEGQSLRTRERLLIEGNSVTRVVSRLNRCTETPAAYESVIVTGNRLDTSETSVFARSVTLSNNQFTGVARGAAAVILGESGVVTGNQAEDPNAQVFWGLQRPIEAANLLGFSDVSYQPLSYLESGCPGWAMGTEGALGIGGDLL
jgi:hypothetical protein